MSTDYDGDFMSSKEIELMKTIRARSRFFSNVEILTCAAGDTMKKITEALASLGLFVLIEVKPRGKLPVIDDGQPWPIIITITENPTINRGNGKFATGKSMRMALEEMARLVDEDLGIGEATVEDVADPAGREIVRITGRGVVTISKTNKET